MAVCLDRGKLTFNVLLELVELLLEFLQHGKIRLLHGKHRLLALEHFLLEVEHLVGELLFEGAVLLDEGELEVGTLVADSDRGGLLYWFLGLIQGLARADVLLLDGPVGKAADLVAALVLVKADSGLLIGKSARGVLATIRLRILQGNHVQPVHLLQVSPYALLLLDCQQIFLILDDGGLLDDGVLLLLNFFWQLCLRLLACLLL